jgi:TolB-like protein/class 3 adenylate cyclase/Tfp pilus assembly protein PilF
LTGERVERRLAAILAADVEGYSRLMGTDEVTTLRDLTQRRTILDGLIASHRGRIANTAGDSVLAEFGSAVDAVQCAVEAQAALAGANADLSPERHINFRIGVHVGDVMVKGGDLFGDGVNIAARLQTLASAGGVCVSGVAHDQVRKILPFTFTDLGAQQVKNIEEPVRAYAVSARGTAALAGNASVPLALPDKPSIAVLPFQNMSGDPEQEYFADGMVEDIITALSRFRSLFVIARNSSFTYKGKAVDIKRVGRELGVRYVLEGSIRKAAGRVRITGQLIETTSGGHLWAERFDRPLEDIFELQDEIAGRIVSAIAPVVDRAEIETAKRKPTGSLDAYDLYLQATAALYQLNGEATNRTLDLLNRALELDPDFAKAHCLKAFCFSWRKLNSWMTNPPGEIAEAEQHARRSVELDRDDAWVLACAGYTLATILGDFDDGVAYVDQALALNPNLAIAWGASAWIRVFLGELDIAIDHAAQYMKLSPLDPNMQSLRNATASAHLFAGRFEEAASWARRALQAKADFHPALRLAASAEALAGNMTAAFKHRERLQQLDPALRLSNVRNITAPYRASDFELYLEGLRKAGLPE